MHIEDVVDTYRISFWVDFFAFECWYWVAHDYLVCLLVHLWLFKIHDGKKFTSLVIRENFNEHGKWYYVVAEKCVIESAIIRRTDGYFFIVVIVIWILEKLRHHSRIWKFESRTFGYFLCKALEIVLLLWPDLPWSKNERTVVRVPT